jgi:hypothetical protein
MARHPSEPPKQEMPRNGFVCTSHWRSPGREHQQSLPKTRTCKTPERGRVQAVTEADLAYESLGRVMDETERGRITKGNGTQI